ncbi:gibberellin-regulated protein 5-like [Nymphaea colorata]|uniref:gibberellin-regulated protein 5-like n=1 Tax=Nymphaea colorata TaxID=210225 RepID=UPI00129EB34E|nr:gibberellin-regulated protein 5-like [Nymphaea colorata]
MNSLLANASSTGTAINKESLLLHCSTLPKSVAAATWSSKATMARFHFLSLLLMLMLSLAQAFLSSLSNAQGYYGSQLYPSECGERCSYRCSATHHRRPCMFFCQKCCAMCLCVPPGTYGNREYCPCYNNWKNKAGRSNCP